MGTVRIIAANILGGGYAAPAVDVRSGRVLVGCVGAGSPDFSGGSASELVGQAVRIVSIGRAPCGSLAGLGNGGFPPFLGARCAHVARGYVARRSQAIVSASFFEGSPRTARFRTAPPRAAGRGVPAAQRAGAVGGGDPLAGARAWYLPRRVGAIGRGAIFSDRPCGSEACRFARQGRGWAANLKSSSGVGGLGGSKPVNPVGATPKRSDGATGQGAKRLCEPGGLRKPLTLGGGRNRVN